MSIAYSAPTRPALRYHGGKFRLAPKACPRTECVWLKVTRAQRANLPTVGSVVHYLKLRAKAEAHHG